MSISGKVPGTGSVPAPSPESDYEKQIKQAAREQQALIAAGSGLAQEKAAKEAEAIKHSMDLRDQLSADEAKRQAAFEGVMRQREQSLQNLQAQVLDLSKQSIDPNRFWNNKSDGQKAAAVIAGALFGFTGQGMQWLQRLDSLVEQDIQAQASDLQRKRGALSDAANMQNNLIAMAEAQGLRGKQAYDAAVATAKENLADQLLLNAKNYAQPELKIQAEQAALAIRASAAKNISDYQRQTAIDAQDARLKQAQINHLNAQSFAMSMKAKGGAGGKGRAVSPQLAARVANTKLMISTLQNMKELAQNSGLFDRMRRAGAEQLTSEENGKLKQYQAGQFEIARLRAGSSLQKPEQEALLPLINDRSGRFDPVPGIEEAIKKAEAALKIDEETAANATAGDLGSTPSGEGDFPEVAVE